MNILKNVIFFTVLTTVCPYALPMDKKEEMREEISVFVNATSTNAISTFNSSENTKESREIFDTLYTLGTSSQNGLDAVLKLLGGKYVPVKVLETDLTEESYPKFLKKIGSCPFCIAFSFSEKTMSKMEEICKAASTPFFLNGKEIKREIVESRTINKNRKTVMSSGSWDCREEKSSKFRGSSSWDNPNVDNSGSQSKRDGKTVMSSGSWDCRGVVPSDPNRTNEC
jgi:hypothetical protein